MELDINKIKVKKRFRKELGDIEKLAESIKELGLLHPIVVNKNNELIAGYRRLEAFKLLGKKEIPVRKINLKSIMEGEFGENIFRKDFSPSEKFIITKELEKVEKKKARERMIGKGVAKKKGEKITSEKFTEDKGEAKAKASEKLGWSRPTYEKVGEIVEESEKYPEDEEIQDIKKYMDEKNNVSGAYRKLKKKKRKELKDPEFPEGKYRVIYADPPWRYNDSCQEGAIQAKGAEDHYPVMSIQELCNLPIPEITTKNAVLFLWTTSPLLEDSFKIINAWDFEYKTSFIWDKIKHNMGHYNSVRHEFLLVCVKGSCTPDNLKLFDSVQSIERTKHSEKPEKFYDIIETLYTEGKKIELFAREKRQGWDSYGDEL